MKVSLMSQLSRNTLRNLSFLAGMMLVGSALTGCQSTVGGQTLPSPDFLRDDVQYFPTYSEDLIPNQRRALEEYNAEQKAKYGG